MAAESELDKECLVYCRYLTGLAPGDYVLGKYRDCHELRASELRTALRTFDWLLWRLSARGTTFCRFTDGYARFFAKHGTLRRKLVLLLAILECSPPFHEYVDRADARRNFAACLLLATDIAAGAVVSLLAVLAFGPLHLAFAVFNRRRVSSGGNAPQ